MGVISENVAKGYGVTREEQVQAAVLSHQRAAAATTSGNFKDEIISGSTKIVDPKSGEVKPVTISIDDGIRPNANLVDLGKLKPTFKKNESTTAVNASQDLKEDSHESVHEPELVEHSSTEENPHDEVGEVYKDSHQSVEQAGDSRDDDKAGLDTSIQCQLLMSNILILRSEGSDSLSREELGRLVASRWTREKTEQGKEEESDASSDKDNQILMRHKMRLMMRKTMDTTLRMTSIGMMMMMMAAMIRLMI